MATDSDTGSGATAGTTSGEPLGANVSPVTTSASLGTATMSPASASADRVGLLPLQPLEDVEPLVGVGTRVDEDAVGPNGPDSTRSREILPT